MIFGSRDKFAIEATYLDRHGKFVYGHALFWLNGLRLGHPEKSVDLNILYDDLICLVRDFDKYHDDLISYLGPTTVLHLIKGIGVVVELVPKTTAETFAHFQGFVVSTDFGDAINEYLVVVTVDGDIMRFLWSKETHDDEVMEEVMEAHVERDQLISAIKEFCEWYETLEPNPASVVKPWQ